MELENKFKLWLEIEIAACEVFTAMGIIPPADMKIIKERASFSVGRILEIENQVHHDVIAFLTAVGENVGEAGRYIHYGLTSSDIVDTAFSIQLVQAGKIIISGLERLSSVLADKALAHKDTPCMGRSHGVHAEPTTFGMKMLLFRQEINRDIERMRRAVENAAYGKFSGAVGTFSNIDPSVEEKVCAMMGLKADPVSTQVIQRDRHAEYMAALAITAGTLDKIATEIRHLQRTEVREAEEPFQKGQKGSSAMPHKRNPILCERVTGLARVIKGNLAVALDNMTLWHERDISHSSAERVIFPDSTAALDYLIHRMIFVIENLHVYPENMMNNIMLTGGLFYSQSLMLKIIEGGILREDAYAAVQEIAMRVWNGDGTLESLARADARINTRLTDEDFKGIFNLERYLKNIDFVYKKAGLIK